MSTQQIQPQFSLEPPTRRERFAQMLELRPRELLALAVLAAAIVAGASVAFLRAMPRPEPAPPPGASLSIADPFASGSAAAGTGKVVVHVAGAVRSPGVYDFVAGARVADAIRAAGGVAATADTDSINLARPLSDGERVYVPRRGETPPQAQQPGGSGGGPGNGGPGTGGQGVGDKININTATVADLDRLPGIGPAIAQRIVDYRTQHGPFRSIRDLLKVEGIGDKKFEGLKDSVTV